MNCLALDLGTKTGFCIFKTPFDVVKSGTQNFSPPSKSRIGKRFINFRKWLNLLIPDNQIQKVYYEDVKAHKGTQAAHIYGGFLYLAAVACEDYDIPIYGVGVSTIKKYVSGNGRASKEEMIKAIQHLGFNPIDDNEADAIGIALTSTYVFNENQNPARKRGYHLFHEAK